MEDISCDACSWSPQRQAGCRYHSHIKLDYSVSDRGVWSVGSRIVIKERSTKPPNFEAQGLRFISSTTAIPVPGIISDWTEESGNCFLVMDRVPGEPLASAWPGMSDVDKERIAKQAAEYLAQLRSLQSPRLQSLGDQPLYSAFLFRNGYGLPHGPIASDDELWGEMMKALSGLSEKVCRRLRKRMPPAAPYTFTHGDLSTDNIIVQNGSISGIIDWEASGYFPVWWESTATKICQGDDDRQWKTLLCKHIEEHADGQAFWSDYYTLSMFPSLDDRGESLLRELEAEEE
ncbi:hypothetical protein FZEAL_10935 [Fusarium zealandicum]|uniref:Aminoglycoside phosphotransferase domain-containing protein n=1 Tax=Fusarium zealandicum TaxID=1053134 RepID=A0A8H4X662_9HYPO|nr:hypothetical protein FZEAL_10935 [Fusarium zealandicum]